MTGTLYCVVHFVLYDDCFIRSLFMYSLIRIYAFSFSFQTFKEMYVSRNFIGNAFCSVLEIVFSTFLVSIHYFFFQL
jgi:hypothetical protein